MIFNDKNYFIDDRIYNVKFSCDLDKCKGGCCSIEGALGAPVLGDEVIEINNLLDKIFQYLPEINKKLIEKEGFYKNIEGELSLNNVDDKECVFSYFEYGVVKCAFQKAYIKNEICFKKPISCELFPVRVSGKYKDTLRYEKYYGCEDALAKGMYDNISLIEFIKEAIVRRFGNGFYENLVKNNNNGA